MQSFLQRPWNLHLNIYSRHYCRISLSNFGINVFVQEEGVCRLLPDLEFF